MTNINKVRVRRRIVRLFITDPGDDMPLDETILLKTDEYVTDATDAELFLGADVPGLIAAHNEKRKARELEPVKARDLTFVVATIIYL